MRVDQPVEQLARDHVHQLLGDMHRQRRPRNKCGLDVIVVGEALQHARIGIVRERRAFVQRRCLDRFLRAMECDHFGQPFAQSRALRDGDLLFGGARQHDLDEVLVRDHR